MDTQPNNSEQWKVGSVVNFGHLNGKVPLQWLVLREYDDYRLLLCTEYVAHRQIDAPSTSCWKRSLLRHWLNKTFLFDAFSLDEQQLICRMSGDYVSLPNRDEIKHWQPFPACIQNDDQPWWLCSYTTDSDDDTFLIM